MYPEFAYSRAMQIILAGISFITAFIFVYFISNIILQLYGESATKKQKCVFAFLVGVILDSLWVYLIYILGGLKSFSDTVYLLVVTTNPVFAILYYFIGIKVLNLSPVRSIKLLGYVYIYFITIKSLSRLISSIFFVQQSTRYNYLLDALNRIAFLIVFIGIILVTQYMLKKDRHVIKLRDNLFINLKKEFFIYNAKTLVIYLAAVGLPHFISEKVAVNTVLFIFYTMGLALTIVIDLYRAEKNETENNIVHLIFLNKGISASHVNKPVVLEEKLNENPSLVSILIKHRECANKMNVKMNIVLNCSIRNLYIGNIDACRIVDCILENAIDSAADSEEKWVSFTVESKADKRKMFIVCNSIATPNHSESDTFDNAVSKRKHSGRLAEVYSIILNYGNCIFHFEYCSSGIINYLEMKQD